MNAVDRLMLRLYTGTAAVGVTAVVGYGLLHLVRDPSLLVVPAVTLTLVVGLVAVGDLSLRAVAHTAAWLDRRGDGGD